MSRRNKSSVIKIKARHMYDTPEVYQEIYGRPQGQKVNEATLTAEIVSLVKPDFNSVLELCSGVQSKHKETFLRVINRDVKYFCMDGTLSKTKEKEVIYVNNIAESDFQRKFDVMLALYYSINSIVNFKTGKITRSHTSKAIKNFYKHLKKGGILFLDLAIDGYRLALSGMELENGFFKVKARYFSPLVKTLLSYKVPVSPEDTVHLLGDIEFTYERLNGSNVDHIKSISVLVNNEEKLRYTYEQPFVVHYYTEPEIVDMLLGAGFNKLRFWDCNYENESFAELENVIYLNDAPTEESELFGIMPNVITAEK